jgi:cullin 1
VEEKLNIVMSIFEYMNDKDVFQTFYSQLLAKRLVTRSYFSHDLESNVGGWKDFRYC